MSPFYWRNTEALSTVESAILDNEADDKQRDAIVAAFDLIRSKYDEAAGGEQ